MVSFKSPLSPQGVLHPYSSIPFYTAQSLLNFFFSHNFYLLMLKWLQVKTNTSWCLCKCFTKTTFHTPPLCFAQHSTHYFCALHNTIRLTTLPCSSSSLIFSSCWHFCPMPLGKCETKLSGTRFRAFAR